jgi:hypothetical protein
LNGFELDLDVPPADGDLLIYNTDISAWENSKTLTGNYTVSGSLTVTDNFTVLGSASITYISESTLNIGTNLITVNTTNPGARFGGLAVIDSGSSPQISASFLYDSIKDEFVFVHHSIPITSSVFLQGPETYNDLGNEIYLTANRIPKGTGIEHLNDSNISDDGSVIKTISGSNDIGLKLDFANTNQLVQLGDINTGNELNFEFDSLNGEFTFVKSNTGDQLLRLDFTNDIVEIGNINNGFNAGISIQQNNSVQILGGQNNNTKLAVDDQFSLINTQYGGNDIGLKLDFSSSKFTLGDTPNGFGFVYDAPNQLYYFGDYGQNGNTIEYNSSTGIITTNFGFDNNGLKFEMSNAIYQFGQITGGNQTKLTIDDATQTVTITGSVAVTGLSAGTGSGDVLMYNTASGQFFFTGSSAIGGGGNATSDNFQQIFLLMGG